MSQDEGRLIAASALAEGGAEEDKKRLAAVQKTKNITFNKLRSFNQFFSEAMIISLVDNFLCYLSEIVQLCMRTRPNVLKSSEQVKIEDILKSSTMDEVIEFLVEKKLNELSYGGVSSLNKFCYDRLGLPIWETKEEEGFLVISVELRNIYTHNRGVVNALFLRKIMNIEHNFKFVKEKRFHVSFDDLVMFANNMMVVAQRLDARASKKFMIDVKCYPKKNS